MANEEKVVIPIKKDMWEISGDGTVNLIGSKCLSCGELFFPEQAKNICTHCQSNNLEKIKLDGHGTIMSFTVVEQKPAGGFYFGPVPYAYGWVTLNDGVSIETLFTGCELDELKVGMEVEVVVEKLHDNAEGAEVLTYKCKPVKKQAGGPR
ncbi:Zn-ribbon domain-containing OB-fold protein [Candidatus Formimonas warabiya]|nr:OB-fold domain-containing protein [Candidatus Formimonas warabiya]